MKNLVLLSFALIPVIFAGKLKAQSVDSEESNFKFGIGIDIEIADHKINPVLPPANILLSFDLLNILRIEPGFGYNQTNIDAVNHEVTALYKRQCYNLGLYWLINNEIVAPFIGINYDYIRNSYDDDDQESNSRVSYETKLGPVFGLEYRISDKFSLSGEYSLLRTKKYESIQVYDEEPTQTGDSWASGNKIKLRFYF